MNVSLARQLDVCNQNIAIFKLRVLEGFTLRLTNRMLHLD